MKAKWFLECKWNELPKGEQYTLSSLGMGIFSKGKNDLPFVEETSEVFWVGRSWGFGWNIVQV